MNMTLGDLNKLVQGSIKMHGENAKVDFLYQTKTGRTKVDVITSYKVIGIASGLGEPIVRFKIGYARGEQE